ncbi:MAG: hypothetical protein N4A65_00980 [Cohaesibacter sp.]|jgi:hypothetical protein|nr:hypothetical protein [Cohaesibacter sp.]
MQNPSDTKSSDKTLSVIDKLKAHRAANEGEASFPLPETGITVTFPKFRNHGQWQRCLRLAKNNLSKAQLLYICQIAKFDGEKLTDSDFRAYVPLNDANELLAEIFGGSDEDEDEGN